MTAAAGSSTHENPAQEIFVFGPFRLNALQRRIDKGGGEIRLSTRAFDILLTLVRQAGTVVSKNELMARTWPDSSVDENSLRVHIAALRKALGDGHAGVRYLSTVSGQGYCFVGSISGTEQAQPTPPPAPPYVHNLPPHPRQIVGREQTIRDISERLRSKRFVTVVGPGGIGKTTTVVSAGHALLAEFAGQVHFVSLGETGDAALVPAVAAASLGLPARSNDPSASLAALLHDRRLLLILDCCEHVIEAAATLAERLYREAPELHILATSRELLRVEGEHTYRLLPLASPPEKAILTAASALAFPAVELFVKRAASAGSEFALTDANASDVGNLCRRLDGIPLAIELTASHVGTYGARAMVQLLDQHFNLLWEGRRTALPRHRTLRATIEWSYNLLSESEREILDRLSVFAGSFTLDAARAIAASANDDDTILANIDSLVAKSMLVLSAGAQSTRYRLADATRAYAQERLAAQASTGKMARRHASYFLGLLERTGGSAADDFTAAADQFGNIRSALAWCFSDRGNRCIGVALTAASIPLFFKLSLLTECEHWVARAIEALGETTDSGRHALALHAALGSARTLTGQFDELAMTCLNRALELAEKIGDASGQVRIIDRLHLLQLLIGKFDDAMRTARRGEAIALEGDDPAALSRMRVALGISCHYLGDVPASRSYVEAAMSHPGTTVDIDGGLAVDYPGRAPITLARILWLQGNPDRAMETARTALSDALAMNHPIMLCRALLWAFDVFYWNEELESYEDPIDRLLAETRRHNLSTLQIVAEAMKGIALLARGAAGLGLPMLRGAVEKLQNLHFGAVAGLSVPLAAAQAAADHGDAALNTINQAIAQARRCSFLMEMPDMLRVKAEALTRKVVPDLLQAEQNLTQSLELARQQGALGYELRTAIALARLQQRQGRHQEAGEVLSPVYDRFTEGFHTRSLTTARDLLSELGHSRFNSLAAS